MTDPLNKMIQQHTNAVIELTLANAEQIIYTLRGTEEPTGDYAKGYRDAIDTVLIQMRKLSAATMAQSKLSDD